MIGKFFRLRNLMPALVHRFPECFSGGTRTKPINSPNTTVITGIPIDIIAIIFTSSLASLMMHREIHQPPISVRMTLVLRQPIRHFPLLAKP